ncbi:MAG: hypothetical protein O7D30_05080, partial [Rickettsia endosymbiont of Ixodes persulcatus]|nr:hypothetical protein [Rickettsia endosymbiont of Ixodes persulcatus]
GAGRTTLKNKQTKNDHMETTIVGFTLRRPAVDARIHLSGSAHRSSANVPNSNNVNVRSEVYGFL